MNHEITIGTRFRFVWGELSTVTALRLRQEGRKWVAEMQLDDGAVRLRSDTRRYRTAQLGGGVFRVFLR